MKKLLGLLGSFGLIASTATSVISCGGLGDLGGIMSSNCYDEDWRNVTDKDSNKKQWDDILILALWMDLLPKEIFPDSKTFYEKMNHLPSTKLKELVKILTTTDESSKEFNFKLDFTFLITNYESISGNVINQQMKQKLWNEDPGTYLFLNLPSINLDNIENEPRIDFQFLFLNKDSSGIITNNENNAWFYWYEYDCINRLYPDPDREGKYLFNLLEYASTKRVVTISPK